MASVVCPLCDSAESHESWLKLDFGGKTFAYLECEGCRSLFCSPMPKDDDLARMYDGSYIEDAEAHGEDVSLAKFQEVLDFLETRPKGLFLDYGCGDGKLLLEVKKRGWEVIGVDFNPDFAAPLHSEGIVVLSPNDSIEAKADIVHLGDVIEHLTALKTQFPEILDLLKPGGHLVAHGPLEGNKNLFYSVLKLGKTVRKNVTSMPPFHILLATTKGQKQLFLRNGLEDVIFTEQEVDFPAPSKISLGELSNIRRTTLFGLRKLSQLFTRAGLGGGNRYFYVGTKAAKRRPQ